MKYIRTKDGTIIDVTGKKIVGSYHDMKPDEICINCEYREADNIEELCDDAVFFGDDGKPHYKSKEGIIWYIGASFYVETIRFGIFTDKGLIYVAKMNEKGDFELL